MNEEIQAVDAMLYAAGQTMRVTVDAAVVVLRLSGHAAKQLAASLLAHLKSSTQKEMGEISLRAMVKRGEPFDMIAINPADANKFQRLAKQTGLLYSIHADEPDYDNMQIDGLTTILYRQQDAPLVNSILQRCQINTLGTMQAEPYPDAASPDLAQTTEPTAAWANQEHTNETIPNLADTYNTLQQQMEQNLSGTSISSAQQLDRQHHSGEDPQEKQKPDREKEQPAIHTENPEQQTQSLLETQHQLEAQMRANLKPPIHRDRSMEL